MANIKVFKVKGYSHLAPFLVNGDSSGLSDEELFEADMFLESIQDVYGGDAYISSIENEEEFGVPEYGGLPGTVCDYIVLCNVA